MRLHALPFLLAFLVLPAAGGGVYKWTDAQGRVHYSDAPPPSQGAQRLRTDRPDEDQALAERRRLADRLTQSELARQKAREAEERRQAEEEKRRTQAEQCQRAQEQLALLQQNTRLTRIDVQGRRHVLNEAERATAMAEARRQIDAHCQ